MSLSDEEVVGYLRKHLQRLKTFDGYERVLQRVDVVEGGRGWSVFEMVVTPQDRNSHGTLHGGLMATLADALSSWTLTTMDTSRRHASTALNLSYVKPARMGTTVRIHVKVQSVGRRMAFLTIEIKDKQSNKILAHATHRKVMLENDSKL